MLKSSFFVVKSPLMVFGIGYVDLIFVQYGLLVCITRVGIAHAGYHRLTFDT